MKYYELLYDAKDGNTDIYERALRSEAVCIPGYRLPSVREANAFIKAALDEHPGCKVWRVRQISKPLMKAIYSTANILQAPVFGIEGVLPVGCVDYYGFNGEVVESLKAMTKEELLSSVEEDDYVGAAYGLVLYRYNGIIPAEGITRGRELEHIKAFRYEDRCPFSLHGYCQWYKLPCNGMNFEVCPDCGGKHRDL